MKKFLLVVLCGLLAMSCAGVAIFASIGPKVKLYSPAGNSIEVLQSEAESYLGLGWYLNYEDVTTLIYDINGSFARVYNNDLPSYLSLGWYDKYEDVVTTLYALDGRTITVFKGQADAYIALGWYRTYEEVVIDVKNSEGTRITIYKAELDSYKAQGWLPVREVDPSKPMVALTFDDGPSKFTTAIADCLEQHNAAATFFMVGNRVTAFASTVARLKNLGMELGNHTYAHEKLTKIGADAIRSTLAKTDNDVFAACGAKTTLVRPPYGAHNQATDAAVGAPVVLWSIDTLDWKTKDAESTVNKVLLSVQDGDIILMHDIYEQSAEAAVRLIPALIERGYQLVTVSEMGNAKLGGLVNGAAYTRIR